MRTRSTIPVPAGAMPAALPATLAPQLATLVKHLPASGEWSFEVKWDGYRMLARVDGHRVRMFSRNGNDWTAKMPGVVGAVAALDLASGWLDGEVVLLDDQGRPDFNGLQNAFDQRRPGDLVYVVFDAPFVAGYDLRRGALRDRRAVVAHMLAGQGRVRFSADFEGGTAQQRWDAACRHGLEGLIGKRVDSRYESTRAASWIKLKCRLRQEFVVVGFTDRDSSAAAGEVGSLLLGVYDEAGGLLYAGSVGTGWDMRQARALREQLLPLLTYASPLAGRPKLADRFSRRAPGGERWVRPELLVEVEFAEWTPDAKVRHSTFKGVRTDKVPVSIRRERPT